jgi:hypothetical protein
MIPMMQYCSLGASYWVRLAEAVLAKDQMPAGQV